MSTLWAAIQRGYLRLIEPIADWTVARRVSPNTITTIGTAWAVLAGVIYATGHIRTAGWVFGLTAFFDVLDGQVARRTGRATTFGAFYDSTLDRIADAAILGGLLVFYASDTVYHNLAMVVVSLVGIVGAFLTSYTRARAEALGLDAKVGWLQRPERVVLLSAPQAFFGLALDGYVLMGIVTLLAVTSVVTAAQRILYVRRVTAAADAAAERAESAALGTPAATPAPPAPKEPSVR